MSTAAATMKFALSFVGYHEGANNANKFSADLGRPGEAWCSDFAVDIRKRAGVKEVNSRTASASCAVAEAGYRAAGRLHTSPQVGDQGFLWDGSTVCHTFYVTAVLGSTVQTVEGNEGDKVSRNTRRTLRSPGGHGVRSYGRPLYSSSPAPKPTPKPTPPGPHSRFVTNGPHRVVSPGDRNDAVRVVQQALGGLTVDGQYGPKTKAAILAFQHKHGLTADGIVGPNTWHALYLYGR